MTDWHNLTDTQLHAALTRATARQWPTGLAASMVRHRHGPMTSRAITLALEHTSPPANPPPPSAKATSSLHS